MEERIQQLKEMGFPEEFLETVKNFKPYYAPVQSAPMEAAIQVQQTMDSTAIRVSQTEMVVSTISVS
jgi:hypothetical protein